MQGNLPEDIIKRYLEGTASQEEKDLVDSWHLHDVEESNFVPSKQKILDTHKQLRKSISRRVKAPIRTIYFARSIAATILVAIVTYAMYFYLQDKNVQSKTISQSQVHNTNQDVFVSNKAVLTLGDGRKIEVAGLPSGKIDSSNNVDIHKTVDGKLIYQTEHTINNPSALVYNTLTVPKGGGKHQLTLSDGSIVVLDAASSIRFPVLFNGDKREVFITGQAYFEVVHDIRKPFFVYANNRKIEDLGTHFNVNSFDKATKTTLLEGSIKVGVKILVPGQQAIEQPSGELFVKSHVNIEEVVAWKNDQFMFDGTADLKTVMEQIGRWYDMEIVFNGNPKVSHFGGNMPRYAKLSDILKILAYNGINCTVEGKTIIVNP